MITHDPQHMQEEDPLLLTVSEVATWLRVDATTVRRWITSGAIAAVALPSRSARKSYRIHRSVIEALVTQRQEVKHVGVA